MSDNTNNNNTGTSPTGRRSSFAGQTLADLFGVGRNRPSVDNTNASQSTPVNQFPGSVASAAAEVQRRRMSVSGQAPQWTGKRSDSIASTNSSYNDESAIEDGEPAGNSATPFARRMSFGARALRDVRTGSSPTSPGGVASSAPQANDSGYNWADSFRNRAERRSSVAGSSPPTFSHMKTKSMASSQPPPVKEVPHNVPDHFQERILKGDFYMD